MDALFPFVEAFYKHFNYPYHETEKRHALTQLLQDPSAGRAYLILHGKPAGYVLLSFYFSLEYGGRTAIIDELFVDPTCRQRGIGTQTLQLIETACDGLGVRALHLESERENTRAIALYSKLGFLDLHRHLLTKRLPSKVYR